jgi:ribA/ribD-fused uncharacterized protein
MSDTPQPEQFVFFWGHAEGATYACFSQFYAAPFTLEGQRFGCTEQWMHWKKACLFGDKVVAVQILAESDPFAQKKLGRQVTPFDGAIWSVVARDIVLRGNLAKFSQNPALKEVLAATAGRTIVEAAPRDTIWGIGLGANNPKSLDRSQWRGTNWLGEVLTEVRVALCAE